MFIGSAFVVLVILMCALVFIYALGKRYTVHLEVQRKLMHMALGSVSLSFPFLFNTPLEVALVMLSSLGVLISLHYVRWLRQTLGESIFGVKRSWLGGGGFAVAVALLFYVAGGNYLLYAGPLLVVTFADALAAIVGTRYARKHYRILGTHKSVEGTVAFVATAFVAILILLSVSTDLGLAGAVLISVVVAISTAVAELFSGRDLDNVTVPAVSFFCLYYLV